MSFLFYHSTELLQNAKVSEIQKFCRWYPVSLNILDDGRLVLAYDPIKAKEMGASYVSEYNSTDIGND